MTSIDDNDETMPRSRGLFIVFEGIDFSGKSTQARLLVESLAKQGIATVGVSFPFYDSPTGQLLRSYLRGETKLEAHAAHLLFSANRWEKIDEIESLIRGGTTVVCDRYSFSGIAYTMAKGVEFDWAQHADEDLLVPDVQIYLHLKPEEASERASNGARVFGEDDCHEKIEFLDKVTDAFLGTLISEEDWELIDALEPSEKISAQVLEIVMRKRAEFFEKVQ